MGVLDEVRGDLSLVREADGLASSATIAKADDGRDPVTLTEVRKQNENTPVSFVEHDLTYVERRYWRADADNRSARRPIREVTFSSLKLVGVQCPSNGWSLSCGAARRQLLACVGRPCP